MISKASIGFYATLVAGVLLFPSYGFAASTPARIFSGAQSSLSASAVTATASTTTSPTTAPIPLSDAGELVALTRPAIVRIVLHWEGTTTIPGFAIDENTNTWIPDPRVTEPANKPYDLYTGGSGFIINSDGYILTNSHVVSAAYLRKYVATQLLSQYILYALFFADDAKTNQWFNALSSDDYDKLKADGIKYLESHLSFSSVPTIVAIKPTVSLATTTSITELQKKQAAESKKIADDIIRAGVPATVVYVNDAFEEDQKDFAVIKINKTDLPSFNLGDSARVTTGETVYNFGYPANADYNGLNSDPTFTKGTVNGTQDSAQHTFKYIQMDSKISPGSSGSPLFDQSGDVIGIITQYSGSASGDGFGFAIPINLVKETVADLPQATSTAYTYPSLVTQGLESLHALHCKTALLYLNRAASMNTTFSDPSVNLKPYITECEQLIASGKSVDSPFDVVRSWAESKGPTFWIGTGSVLFLVLVGGLVLLFLFKKLRREEVLIETLQHEVEHPAAPPAPLIMTQPAPAVIRAINPTLADYVKKMRSFKQNDQQIKTALVSAGWNTEDVSAALVMPVTK